jgi:hypothetical protein
MWGRRHNILLAVAFILPLLCFVIFPKHTAATTGINQELSFEGKVVTAAGINIPDGTYNMEFKVYTAAGSCNPSTGAGCTLGWTEDWLVSASQGVTFTSGTFQANLGSITAFGGNINWNTFPLYLSLQVGSTTSCTPAGNFTTNCGGDGEMKPYILLTSTPYAMNAGQLGGLAASSFGQLAANQTWTGFNTFQPAASTTAFQVQNATSNNVLAVDTSSNSGQGQVIFGKASTNTGTLVLNNSTNTNSLILQSGTTGGWGVVTTQHASIVQNSAATTMALTFPAGANQNDRFIISLNVCASGVGVGTAAVSLSDNKSNTWTKHTESTHQQPTGFDCTGEVWSAPQTTVGASIVTITYTGPATGNLQWSASGQEYTGLSTATGSAAVDVSTSAVGTATTASSGAPLSPLLPMNSSLAGMATMALTVH